MSTIKHKLYVKLLLAIGIGLGAVVFGAPQQASAAFACPDGYTSNAAVQFKSEVCADHRTGTEERDSVEAEEDSSNPAGSGTSGTGSGANVVDSADCRVDPADDLNEGNCGIIKWINTGINILSVLVGIVVTIMIIVGGIQYTAAGADPNAVAKAKKQIFNAIFALVAYGLMYALLDFLVPGGLL